MRKLQDNCFRILSLTLINHKIFKDLQIDFADFEDYTKNQPYISLIIGANGTGKSNLLRVVSDIFRELYSLKSTGNRSHSVSGIFSLKYLYEGHVYTFGNFNDDRTAINFQSLTSGNSYPEPRLTDGERAIGFKAAILPEALLVSSLMITDKFYNDIKGTLPYYKYLGVRTSSNQAGTKTYIRRTVDMLINALGTPNEILTRFKLGDLLENLGFERRMEIQYRPIYRKHFFNRNEPLTEERFRGFFEDYKKYTNRQTPPWGFSRYEKIQDNHKLINLIVKGCNFLSDNEVLKNTENSKSQVLSFEVINGDTITEFADLLKELSLLDLLRAPELVFFKDKNVFTYKESSSGEQHIITTLIGIMSQIKDNSLVMLDEPEMSLHPNWQMKYINDFIVNTFEDYPSCHFIICTHSHFLVSDVKPEGSKVVGLKTDKDGVKVTYHTPENTYGWSAEQLLLDVFRTPTTRNYYVADRIGEILDLIANTELEDNTAAIRLKVGELLKLNLDELPEEDPLKEVMEKLISKYG
mgnify:CR=1 FL=1|tara:strand:- start:7144 stop:8715 length:1572 start_codon:yes stop_codon:yes gene_type:complete